MREGYWINWQTGTVVLIDEHERWIRNPGNREKIGIASTVADKLVSSYQPIRDRDRFLAKLMGKFPVMRVRGHGMSITFEYASPDDSNPLQAVLNFCEGEGGAGELTELRIVNFATGHWDVMKYGEFRRRNEAGNIWQLEKTFGTHDQSCNRKRRKQQ